jgi:hypothetical protein
MSRKVTEMRVKRAFLDPMTRARFPIPEEGDIPALLTEELASYGEKELKDAASFIIRTRKYPTWPTTAEIIEALETVRLQDGKNWRDQDAKKVFIEYGTPQWLAWDIILRRTANPHGLPTTTDRNTGKRGWRCMGDWPPGYAGQTGEAKSPNAGTNQALRIALRRASL